MTKQREFYFDNARLYLIILVVFGHLLRSYIDESPFLYALYMFIYSFHMPGDSFSFPVTLLKVFINLAILRRSQRNCRSLTSSFRLSMLFIIMSSMMCRRLN